MKSILICSLCVSLTAHAATITVNDSGDNTLTNLAGDSKCSLREAVHAANTNTAVDGCTAGNGRDTIIFDSNISGITLAGNSLSVIGDLTVSGHAPDNVVSISGNNQSRIFTHDDENSSLNVFNLFLTAGKTTAPEADNCSTSSGHGGAICSRGYLRVENVLFLGNQVTGNYAAGGAIAARKQLTLSNAHFWRNKSKAFGGAVSLLATENSLIQHTRFDENTAETYGGAVSVFIADYKKLRIHNSEFQGNIASTSSGGALSAAPDSANRLGELIIENSSFHRNKSTVNSGGALSVSLPLTLKNSTIANNTAGVLGAGVWLGSKGNHTLIHNTIANNTMTTTANTYKAAGIYYTNSSGTLTFNNNVLHDNKHPAGSADCHFNTTSVVSARNNVLGDADTACGLLNVAGNANLLGVNPLLDTLQTNDSCTQKAGLDNSSAKCPAFMPLLANSLAIDHAVPTAGMANDQRGLKRDIDGDNDNIAESDAGAYEYGAIPRIYRMEVAINKLAGALNLVMNADQYAGLNAGTISNPYTGTVTFTQKLGDDEAYTVKVRSAPDGQRCTFSNGSDEISGNIAATDVTLNLTCRAKTVYINYNPNPANGTLSCPNTGQSLYGDSPTCTAAPDVGYEVDTWGGDCAGIASGQTCTFNNIDSDKNISVTFKAKPAAAMPFKDSFE